MALKFKIDKLEDVAEAVRSMYVAKDGAYYLDVDGVVPKERLDEFRSNNITLQQQLDRFKNIDPNKYAELRQIQQEIEEGKLIKEGKLEEVVNLRVGTMKQTYEGQLADMTTQLTNANRQLETLMIDNVVRQVATKAGVIPTAVDDVVLRAKTTYVMEKGVPVPKVNGEIIYGKDGTTPMPIDEWVTKLRTEAGHLFQGSSGSGAGGGTAGGRVDVSKMTALEKINYGLANGLHKTGARVLDGA